MTDKTHNPDSLLLPMVMAFTGFTLWTICDAAVRYLRDYPTVVIVFLCTLFSVFFLVGCSSYLGGMRETFRRPRLKLRIFRGFILSISNLLSFITFMNLDLATAYAIIFVSPFLAKILSVLMMGEKIRPRSWAITALGFAGVLVVLRPGWVPLGIGTAAALSLTFFFSLGYILARYIGEENQTALSLTIFQYVFVLLGVAFPAFHLLREIQVTPILVGLTAMIGIVGPIGGIIVARSFSRAPAAYIAPIHYVQILWGLIFGAFLFGEFPDRWTLVGGGIIILAGLLLVRYSRRPVLIGLEQQ